MQASHFPPSKSNIIELYQISSCYQFMIVRYLDVPGKESFGAFVTLCHHAQWFISFWHFSFYFIFFFFIVETDCYFRLIIFVFSARFPAKTMKADAPAIRYRSSFIISGIIYVSHVSQFQVTLQQEYCLIVYASVLPIVSTIQPFHYQPMEIYMSCKKNDYV